MRSNFEGNSVIIPFFVGKAIIVQKQRSSLNILCFWAAPTWVVAGLLVGEFSIKVPNYYTDIFHETFVLPLNRSICCLLDLSRFTPDVILDQKMSETLRKTSVHFFVYRYFFNLMWKNIVGKKRNNPLSYLHFFKLDFLITPRSALTMFFLSWDKNILRECWRMFEGLQYFRLVYTEAVDPDTFWIAEPRTLFTPWHEPLFSKIPTPKLFVITP